MLRNHGFTFRLSSLHAASTVCLSWLQCSSTCWCFSPQWLFNGKQQKYLGNEWVSVSNYIINYQIPQQPVSDNLYLKEMQWRALCPLSCLYLFREKIKYAGNTKIYLSPSNYSLIVLWPYEAQITPSLYEYQDLYMHGVTQHRILFLLNTSLHFSSSMRNLIRAIQWWGFSKENM